MENCILNQLIQMHVKLMLMRWFASKSLTISTSWFSIAIINAVLYKTLIKFD